MLVLTGKGNKTRRVSLMMKTANILVASLAENHLDAPQKKTSPLFPNSQHNRRTKEGVAYMPGKYAVQAQGRSENVPAKVPCHRDLPKLSICVRQEGISSLSVIAWDRQISRPQRCLPRLIWKGNARHKNMSILSLWIQHTSGLMSRFSS
jgi:hypothetical protein